MAMMEVCLVIILVIALLVQSNAAGDPYDTPSPLNPKSPPKIAITPPLPPPPPFAVAGLTRPPENITCLNTKSKCYGKALKCPDECPMRKPADPTAKGCFVDCGPKCEATCRKRKPNCDGFGALCYDPRFIGGDGIMFYFHGKSNENFALVSDKDFHINAHFIGRRPVGRTRDYTWVQSLGIMFGTHTFTVGANKVSKWDDKVDEFFFTFDNQPFTIPMGHLAVWNAPSTDLTIERTAHTNSINVLIPRILELFISVVPITEQDNRVHNYQIPSYDCFAHLEIQFKFFNPSARVEGVLGQTYKPDFKNPVKVGVPMPIMGGENKYRTSSLLGADCDVCIFKPNSSPLFDSFIVEPTATFDCSNKFGNGQGIVCRR